MHERYMDIQVLKLGLLKSWLFSKWVCIIQHINIMRILMITTAIIGNLLLTHWKIVINNSNLSVVIPRRTHSSQASYCVSPITEQENIACCRYF